MKKKKQRGAPKGHPPYNVNGEGGRPKKWNGEKIEELAQSLDEWIDSAVKNKDQFWWWDWCFDVGLDHRKVSSIAKENDRFRESYNRAKHWQECVVGKGALSKEFSEGFSKFMLVNHYPENWKEKAPESTQYSPEQAAQAKAVSDQLKKAQDEASARRIANKSERTEEKSE